MNIISKKTQNKLLEVVNLSVQRQKTLVEKNKKISMRSKELLSKIQEFKKAKKLLE